MKNKHIKKLYLLNILILLYLIILKKYDLNKPKISVIIPVYNGENFLNHSLTSVLKQKMKDIEIIIIDDNSKDESLKIIKNYMKKDKRIHLIENRENRKILFCKSFGALNSKGKYIIELDQDDMLIGEDSFNILYNDSENNDLDFLKFDFTSGNNILNLPNFDNYPNKSSIIYLQPNSKLSIFRNSITLLWGNLIKTDLYKKVIYNLWPIIINYKIIFQEDYLIIFFMLLYAKKYKIISNVFYYKFKNTNQASHNYRINLDYYLSVIFVGIIFYDYYIDLYSQGLQAIINYIKFLKADFLKIKSFYPEIFNYFFGKILTNNQLLDKNKKTIMKFFHISEKCISYNYRKINTTLFFNELSNQTYNNNYINNKQVMKLSIIIVFSNYDKVKNLINSLKAQQSQYFEIILIFDDDIKNNNFLHTNISGFFKEIKLIKNEIKKGILYSILEGIEVAKGKYVMIINPNCFFLERDSFQKLFNEIEKNDFDILEFNLYKILSSNYSYLYKCKHDQSQFNLSSIKYNLEFNNIDIQKELITNKIFKSIYIKNIIKPFQKNKVNVIVDYYYNDIFSFLFDSYHHKFKRSSEINIYINDNDCNKFNFTEFSIIKKSLIRETIFYIDFIFNNSKNTYEDKQKVLKEFFNLLSIIFNKFTNVSDISFKLLKKFDNCKYFSKTNKTLLKFYVYSLIN